MSDFPDDYDPQSDHWRDLVEGGWEAELAKLQSAIDLHQERAYDHSGGGTQEVGYCVEIDERYCEIAARRFDQGVLDFGSAS